MKLPNFLEFTPLNELRKRMSADLKEWHHQTVWEGLDVIKLRERLAEGIVITDLDEVTTADDGTLEYKGQKIILYIRDQRISMKYQGTAGSGYRFHVADCDMLQTMRNHGRYERYVVASRWDGKFKVNRFYFEQLVEEDVECEIPVCKKCLRRLNYKGYRNKARPVKLHIWEKFNLFDFFDKYSSRITRLPRHTDATAPLNTYSPDWATISTRYRESVNWTCEECGLNLKDHKSFLHVHHKNGVESDNDRQNLQALCIEHHAQKPNHDHLRNSPDYIKFTRFINQGF